MALTDTGTVELSIRDLLIMRRVLTARLCSELNSIEIDGEFITNGDLKDLRRKIIQLQTCIEQQHPPFVPES